MSATREAGRDGKVRFKYAYRIRAYLPTYPPHHLQFKSYLRARLAVEGATTLEGDGVFYNQKTSRPESDKTFIIYSYAVADEKDIKKVVEARFES